MNDALKRALAPVREKLWGDLCPKQRHKSRGAAEAQLRALRKLDRDHRGLENLEVYYCPRCCAWHCGHGVRRLAS